jgi:hypothetical protein
MLCRTPTYAAPALGQYPLQSRHRRRTIDGSAGAGSPHHWTVSAGDDNPLPGSRRVTRIGNRLPVLTHLDLVLTRSANPPSDLRQLVTSAVVNIHAQGATYSGLTPLLLPHNQTTKVPVYHLGSIVDASQVMVYFPLLALPDIYIVDHVDEPPSTPGVWVTSGSDRSLEVGSRLFTVQPTASFYPDPLGKGTGVPHLVAPPETGRIAGYVREFRYDLRILGIPNEVMRSYLDLVGGYVMRG